LPLRLQAPHPLGGCDAGLEKLASPLMNEQLGPEQLQRRLHEGTLQLSCPQCHLPALVIGSPLGCLLVRTAVVVLQHQGYAEQARRHARSAPSSAVELSELLVSE